MQAGGYLCQKADFELRINRAFSAGCYIQKYFAFLDADFQIAARLSRINCLLNDIKPVHVLSTPAELYSF